MRRGCGDQETYTRLRRKALQIAVDFADPHDRLSPICDLIWEELAPRGVSWVGFYLEDPDSPMEIGTENGALLLAARRDKPACSPIGMHGACGQALLEEVVRLVDDVALLGANYIACDPRDSLFIGTGSAGASSMSTATKSAASGASMSRASALFFEPRSC